MPSSRRRVLTGLSCLSFAACGSAEPLAPAVSAGPAAPPPTTPLWQVELGPLDDVDPDLRAAFTDARGFEPLPPPGPGAWRTLRPEPPQTVADFLAERPNPRAAPRDRLALLPLGRFPFEVVVGPEYVGLVRTPELAALAATLAAFFATPVDVLPGAPFPEDEVARRVAAGHHQYDARALLDRVAGALPDAAHGMLALVNVDLFVWREQQYAFGWSTLQGRLGVAGFSRLDPSFHGGLAPDDPHGTLLRRGLRVAVHEAGHLFGLGHCQTFRCAMNGIADLAELDAAPLRLCPSCLRKLHLVTDLDPRARDRELLRGFAALGLVEEAAWLSERVARLWDDTA